MGIKVLSLFDGISCGMVALERAGIEVERYVAFELDKYAISVSKSNYPNIEHRGEITPFTDFTEFKGFDLVIGGSPCTFWSIAQKNNRETEPSGLGYDLFMHFVRAVRESECKYFLYENNHSIDKKIKAAITSELGVDHIMINSALVSAQNRKRCYWTNIQGVLQPQDRGIMLRDVLENGICWNEKIYCISTLVNGAILSDTLMKHRHQMIAQPIRIGDIGSSSQAHRIYSIYGKSVTINAGGGGQGGKTGLYAVPISSPNKELMIYEVKDRFISVRGILYPINLPDGHYIIRKLTVNECCRLQTLPDGYCRAVSNTQAYKGIGNGWTIDVIAHILSFMSCVKK